MMLRAALASNLCLKFVGDCGEVPIEELADVLLRGDFAFSWMTHSAPSFNSSPAMTSGGAPFSFMLLTSPASASCTIGPNCSAVSETFSDMAFPTAAARWDSQQADQRRQGD